MPDSKKTDLKRTFTEQESGIVDPYAESIRTALGFNEGAMRLPKSEENVLEDGQPEV